jgi:MerR family transcriptional regulator, copper efflux regulator
MKIGELAERAGVNVQTVRYYERRDLLPEPERTASGYREYGEADVRRLHFILRAKALGFTLSEIRDLLDLRASAGATAEDVRRRAQVKIEDVEGKLRDLRRIRDGLGRVVASCDAHGPPEECALIHALQGELKRTEHAEQEGHVSREAVAGTA